MSRLILVTCLYILHIIRDLLYKLCGLNWVSKNCRAAHDVEFVLGSSKKDPKGTPDCVFNDLACSITFGTEGVHFFDEMT